MNTLTRYLRVASTSALVSLSTLVALAQAPAQPAAQAPAQAGAAPGGRGGRGGGGGGGGGGGAPAGPTYTSGQLITLAKLLDVPAALTTKLNDARTALTKASVTLPRNNRDITAKAQAVADAELALANARAGGVDSLQKSSAKLSTDQLASIARGANPAATTGNRAAGGTLAYEDYTGFTKIFDGETLTGWDGETDVWSVQDGAIHDDNSPGHTVGQHHIIYVGANHILRDFDFKVEMKMTEGANGGIQYRSRLLSGHGPNRSIFDPATMADPLGTPLPKGVTTTAMATAAGITGGNPWQVSGYQFDMNSANNYTGQLYEGQGRSITTLPGEIVQYFPGGIKMVIGHVADNAAQYVKPLNEWNQLEVIARGSNLIHIMNGHVMSITIDDDPVRRAPSGILSLQLEGSGGQIWYRNVYLKHL